MALSMDDLLLTERMLRDSARSGMDDFLKTDLTMAIDRIPDGDDRNGPESELTFDRHSQFLGFEQLLYPIASHDELCMGAHHLMSRTMLAVEQRKFMLVRRVSLGDDGVDRRFMMALAGVNTYVNSTPDAYDHFGRHLREATTADRVIVLGYTAMFVRDVITGDLSVAETRCPNCGGPDEHEL